LLVAGLLVAYTLFFLLTARSVSITVESETAPSIDISGLHLPFGERFLMRPGTYELMVAAEGYQTFSGPLLVDRAEVQTLALSLTPLPGHSGNRFGARFRHRITEWVGHRYDTTDHRCSGRR
jgi:hypothetical protein